MKGCIEYSNRKKSEIEKHRIQHKININLSTTAMIGAQAAYDIYQFLVPNCFICIKRIDIGIITIGNKCTIKYVCKYCMGNGTRKKKSLFFVDKLEIMIKVLSLELRKLKRNSTSISEFPAIWYYCDQPCGMCVELFDIVLLCRLVATTQTRDTIGTMPQSAPQQQKENYSAQLFAFHVNGEAFKE